MWLAGVAPWARVGRVGCHRERGEAPRRRSSRHGSLRSAPGSAVDGLARRRGAAARSAPPRPSTRPDPALRGWLFGPIANTDRAFFHDTLTKRVSLDLRRSCYNAHELRTSQAECRGFESLRARPSPAPLPPSELRTAPSCHRASRATGRVRSRPTSQLRSLASSYHSTSCPNPIRPRRHRPPWSTATGRRAAFGAGSTSSASTAQALRRPAFRQVLVLPAAKAVTSPAGRAWSVKDVEA